MILSDDLIHLLGRVQSLKLELLETINSDVPGKEVLIKNLTEDITKARVKVSEFFEKQVKTDLV